MRHRLVPYVGFFNLLREAQGSDPQLHAGDVVWLTEISEAVADAQDRLLAAGDAIVSAELASWLQARHWQLAWQAPGDCAAAR